MFQHSAVSKSSAASGLHHTRPEEGTHGPDVGRKVVHSGVDEVVEKARPDQRPERLLPELDGALDEVDRGDSILTVRTQVVADDKGVWYP
jgi:hypothetical protein